MKRNESAATGKEQAAPAVQSKACRADEDSEGSEVLVDLRNLTCIIRREVRSAVMSQGFQQDIAEQLRRLRSFDMQNQTERHNCHMAAEMRRHQTETSNLIAKLEAKVLTLTKELDETKQLVLDARQKHVREEVDRALRELGVTSAARSQAVADICTQTRAKVEAGQQCAAAQQQQERRDPIVFDNIILLEENGELTVRALTPKSCVPPISIGKETLCQHELQPEDRARHYSAGETTTEVQTRGPNVYFKNPAFTQQPYNQKTEDSEPGQFRLTAEWYESLKERRASRSTSYDQGRRKRNESSYYHHPE